MNGWIRRRAFPLPGDVSGCMVLFLTLDIGLDSGQFAFANGKRAIRSLPFKKFPRCDLVSDQVRRRAFDILHQLGHRNIRVQPDEQVNMVRHAAETERKALEFAAFRLNGSIHGRLDLRGDQWQAVPCRPDAMHVQFRK